MVRWNEGTTELVHRVQGEYLEMPGLSLTRAQAQRLWNLDCATCEHLLRLLVEGRFLYHRGDGAYARRA